MTPSFLVSADDVHRIDFDDGSWIDIARCVTAFQRARWTKAATTYKNKTKGRGLASETESDWAYDHELYLAAFLADVVKDTSAGKIDVKQLSEPAVARIQKEFDELNPQPTTAEQIAELRAQLKALEEADALGESTSPSSPTTE